MKHKTLLITALLLVLLLSCGQKELKLSPRTVKKVVEAMTVEEKVKLLVGAGMAAGIGDSAVMMETGALLPGAAGTTYPIPRLGIPAIVLADGPAGLRINPMREGDTVTRYYCTAFPVATALAATWDQDLVESLGEALGNEVLEYGADILLAPAMNLQRNPLCGRNFEYFSEDPVLTGKMAAAYIRGVQSNGVGTAVKHFAANNQETNRQNNDARISQRGLRELYLKGFQIAIKEGEPWTVMTSYNKINGTYTSESADLLGKVLRYDWKFKGAVMTDWFGGKDPVAQVNAGNDLLMPGSAKQYNTLVAAIKDSALSMKVVDANVERLLRLIVKTPRFREYDYSGKPDLKAHASVARLAGSEGMVLMENANVLPIAVEQNREKTMLAVFGITSYDFISGGTGSGDVNEAYTVSLVDGLKKAGYSLHNEPIKAYEAYMKTVKPIDGKQPFALFPKTRTAELIPGTRLLQAASQQSKVGVITIGRTSGEFMDRKVNNDFNLTAAEMQLIKVVSDAFHAEKKPVVVILNIGGPIETASWRAMADAILVAWQPGQEAGNSVADVLSGKVSPSGRLPMTFPLVYADVPSASNFPANEAAAPRVRLGNNIRNVDYTNYEEDIYVGYRFYITFDKKVAYPFGYGLSYTTFKYGKPEVIMKKKIFLVKVPVENAGKVSGKEVVQLYLCPPGKSELERPIRELIGFAKTKELAPGESTLVTIMVAESDLASYNPKTNSMELGKGLYSFEMGSSCLDIKSSVLVNLEQKTWKTADGLVPATGLKTLSAKGK